MTREMSRLSLLLSYLHSRWENYLETRAFQFCRARRTIKIVSRVSRKINWSPFNFLRGRSKRFITPWKLQNLREQANNSFKHSMLECIDPLMRNYRRESTLRLVSLAMYVTKILWMLIISPTVSKLWEIYLNMHCLSTNNSPGDCVICRGSRVS